MKVKNQEHTIKIYIKPLICSFRDFRALPRDEKDGKESKNQSPKKFRSFRSAPHQSIHAKLQESKERSPHKTSPQKQRKKLHGHSFDENAAQDGEFCDTGIDSFTFFGRFSTLTLLDVVLSGSEFDTSLALTLHRYDN